MGQQGLYFTPSLDYTVSIRRGQESTDDFTIVVSLNPRRFSFLLSALGAAQ